ncbi:uncharacterized protein [Diadema setosum]|uniref:uncharacterized protein n=1 Tax=Diadema setosum TaxID=31175 RepID=UPI003B3ADBBB
MGGWYDACTGWWQTNDRLLTYSFTSPFSKQRRVGVYVRQGNPSSVASNPVSVSGLKVGFLDGWFADELCLARYAAASSTVTVQGADQIAASNIVHLQTPDDLIAALNDGRVTVVFSMVLPQLETSLMRLTTDAFPNYCVVTAESMMTTKRNSDFVRWWDDAFNRLVGTKRYTDICNNIEREHGDIPGDNSATICVDP